MEQKMIASLAKVEEKGSGKSPYLAARDEWNERYRDLIAAARNWRLLAVTSSVVALVAVLGLIVIGAKPKVIPYIVAVDNLGKVLPAEVPTLAILSVRRMGKAPAPMGPKEIVAGSSVAATLTASPTLSLPAPTVLTLACTPPSVTF